MYMVKRNSLKHVFRENIGDLWKSLQDETRVCPKPEKKNLVQIHA
jgi:hypothetical protein